MTYRIREYVRRTLGDVAQIIRFKENDKHRSHDLSGLYGGSLARAGLDTSSHGIRPDLYGAPSDYYVRLGTGEDRFISEWSILESVKAPHLGKCEKHKLGLENGCYCRKCKVTIGWIYYNSQSEILDEDELEGHKAGACLALSMFWCKFRKESGALIDYEDRNSESVGFFRELGNGISFEEIAKCQSIVQKDLLEDMEYRHFDEGGQPIKDVSTKEGKENTRKAYEVRLQAMEKWARDHGMSIIDSRVDFPERCEGFPYDSGISQYIARSDCKYGILCLGGKKDGHAFGFMAQDYYGTVYYRFFDPNKGEWVASTLQAFETLVCSKVQKFYGKLNQQWWVVKFA